MQSLARLPVLVVTVVLLAVGPSGLPQSTGGPPVVNPEPLFDSSTLRSETVWLPLAGKDRAHSEPWMQSEPVSPASTTTPNSQAPDDSSEVSTTAPVTATVVPETTVVTTTMPITPVQTITPTQDLTGTEGLVPDALGSEGASEQSEPLQEAMAFATPAPDAGQESADPIPSLEGAIVVNRTEAIPRFFVEGQTYSIPAMRSLGVDLPRAAAVLNLFSCDATNPADLPGCYWDPYLVQQDGFYEIYDGTEGSSTMNLLFRQADAPPKDQVWVQNRTGRTEEIVYHSQLFQLAPTSVQEFSVHEGVPVILYVRNCISMDEQTVCEWSPKTLDTDTYFALVEAVSPGGVSGSTLTSLEFRPIVGSGGEAVASPLQIVCKLKVPALNVRSGPGLQYQIIAKVRGTETELGSALVIGRSTDGQWLSVSDRIAPGGWVTSSSNFMLCDGDVNALPVIEANTPPPTLTPTPVPTEIVGEPQEPPGSEPPSDLRPEEATAPAPVEPAAMEIPEGLAQLVVNNGFQFEMRFTLDQHYRPVQGASEYDLRPGDSVQILVYPGTISFTASSPWNGLSGNAELSVESDQSLALWLRFEPDPGGSSKWYLEWQ